MKTKKINWVQGEYDGTDIYETDSKRVLIAKVSSEEDAELIVRAVRCHAELLEACKLAFEQLRPGNIRKDFSGHIAKAALGTAIHNAEDGL